MANVIFKRGSQADFNSKFANNSEDGVFYLTTDTNRLYVGQGSGQKPKLLNQTVQIVPSIEALETLYPFNTAQQKADHINDFFYCTLENVLAVWDGNEWHQINTNTFVNQVEYSTSSTSNTGYVVSTLTDNAGTVVATAQFAISTTGGASVSAANGGLVIDAKEYAYSLSRGVSNETSAGAGTYEKANIFLTDSKNSTTASVSLKAGNDNIYFKSTGDNVVEIYTENTGIGSASLTLSSTGSLELSISDDTGASTSASLANIGIVLNNGTGNGGQYVTLAATTSTMTQGEIYSKDEIDRKLNGLDGMTYKGIISSTTALPVSGVKNGDVYLVAETGMTISTATYSITQGTIPDTGVCTGDMFIATGEETNGVITGTVGWTYIPAGNEDFDTFTYVGETNAAGNGIYLKNNAGTYAMGLTLAATTGIVVSSTTATDHGADLITTISHAAYNTTTTATTAASSAEFSAITGLTIDNGHITGYQTETFTPVGYVFSDTLVSTTADRVGSAITASTSGTSAMVATNLATEDGAVVSSSLLNLSSSSIKFASTSNPGELVMNMVWEEF